jgi:hypothetical protein
MMMEDFSSEIMDENVSTNLFLNLQMLKKIIYVQAA